MPTYEPSIRTAGNVWQRAVPRFYTENGWRNLRSVEEWNGASWDFIYASSYNGGGAITWTSIDHEVEQEGSGEPKYAHVTAVFQHNGEGAGFPYTYEWFESENLEGPFVSMGPPLTGTISSSTSNLEGVGTRVEVPWNTQRYYRVRVIIDGGTPGSTSPIEAVTNFVLPG